LESRYYQGKELFFRGKYITDAIIRDLQDNRWGRRRWEEGGGGGGMNRRKDE